MISIQKAFKYGQSLTHFYFKVLKLKENGYKLVLHAILTIKNIIPLYANNVNCAILLVKTQGKG